MHRVYAPAAAPPSVELSPPEAHHVTRVLRLGIGDDVAVFDGRGREWAGRIVALGRSVVVDLVEPRTAIDEPAVSVTVGVGLLKGDQMDTVVRDATALGAAAVAPFVSAHVAVPERARQARAVERWQRVAVAAAKQSSRAVVPVIQPLVSLEAVLAEAGAALKVLCVEPRAGGGGRIVDLPRPARALLLVGPEGGWSVPELERARLLDARFVGLGPRTLRAETAPIVALSALWTHWGYK